MNQTGGSVTMEVLTVVFIRAPLGQDRRGDVPGGSQRHVETGGLFGANDGLQLLQEIRRLLHHQAKARGWIRTGTSIDVAYRHRRHLWVVSAFDSNFDDEADLEPGAVRGAQSSHLQFALVAPGFCRSLREQPGLARI